MVAEDAQMPIFVSGGGGPGPRDFQRVMIFVDGTNLFYRLAASRLKVSRLSPVFKHFSGGRQIVRIYLYTVEQHFAKAKQVHGDDFCEGIRVVYGEGVPQ